MPRRKPLSTRGDSDEEDNVPSSEEESSESSSSSSSSSSSEVSSGSESSDDESVSSSSSSSSSSSEESHSSSGSEVSTLSIMIDGSESVPERNRGITHRRRGSSTSSMYDSDDSSGYDSYDDRKSLTVAQRVRMIGTTVMGSRRLVGPFLHSVYVHTAGLRTAVAPMTETVVRFPVVQNGKRRLLQVRDTLASDWKVAQNFAKSENKSFGKLSQSAKMSLGRLGGVIAFLAVFFFYVFAGSVVGGFSARAPRPAADSFDPRWKNTRDLNYTEVLDLIHVYRTERYNDTFYSIPVKSLPGLDKPQYITMNSKELVQIRRPAVRAKRPDEPRAVRTFGCLRDGCRGLAIEDLLDRGWQMRFRAAQNNDTYKNINYRVTFLLTDTTQLNHMKKVRPDLYQTIYNTYEKKCYLLAFDGGDAIGGNKGQQIKVKDKFVRKYGCKWNDLAISPAAYRLYLKDECEDLTNMNADGVTWLLKPETGSQGQGITFHTTVEDVMHKVPQFFPCKKKEFKPTERYLVQEYIEKPLLLKKSKFDVRVYMLIASSSPYLLFYHEGYLRRALAEYSPLSKDRKVYLTNTHFQSMKKGFKLSDHIWPFPTMQDHLRDHGRTGGHYVETMLNPYIKKVLNFIFQTARPKLKKRKGTFHIFGIDFMIDAKWHVWFIEANGYPGFTWSINFDTRNMAEEFFNLGMQVHENPRFYMLMQPGDRFGHFEMLFNELDEERTQQAYNPCEEFKYNRGYTAPLREANKRFAKYSGAGGRTDQIKQFSDMLTGADRLGGPRGIPVLQRRQMFQKFGCQANLLRFTPPTYLMYDKDDCEAFFNEAGEGTAWVLKSVDALGDGKGIEYIKSPADVKARGNLGNCRSRQPDFVIQQYIPSRALFDNKYWDMKVYLLIATTKPFMVFYHHGYLRSARIISGSPAAKDGTDDDDVVEEEEEDEEEPETTNQADAQPQDPNAEEGEEVEEIWSPPDEDLITGASWQFGEEFWTFDKFQDYVARNNLMGSKYVTSVFDTYAKRIAHLSFQAARSDLARSNNTYQLVSMNFVLDARYQIHYLGSRNVDQKSFPDVDQLREHKANMLETMAGLVLESHDMPAAFARMRRGDSYGEWRLVFSEMEERQRSVQFDPCEEMKRNLMVAKSSLFKNAWLHQYAEKKHAANKRELRKYIDKKWRESCRGKPTKELQASCIRNTISYRYKIYLEKEGVPYQDGFVDMTIRDLQNKAAQASGG